jgi:glycosyltransferase involved in cell wall biosynthesis
LALMRIGIDATCWWSRRGFGRVTRMLLPAMMDQPRGHELCLFVDRAPPALMQRPGVEIIQVPTTQAVTEAAVASGSRSLRDLWAFSRATATAGLDLMFFPAVYSWFPLRPGLRSVVTFHDAIAEHFPQLVFPDWRGRWLWALKVRLARLQARRIMTVSNAAREEISLYLGIARERIDVVTEAADEHFRPVTDADVRAAARRRAGLPAQATLLMYVGGLAPHKNLAGLLAGFSQARSRGGLEQVHLAMVGDIKGDGFHSHYEELQAIVNADVQLRTHVHFTGFVPDEDLAALYSDAVALCLPSFSEGFGLPAIEAMACGTPVLGSRAGSIPEVVGAAGILFDPHQPAEIADAIRRVVQTSGAAARMRQTALARARLFTWSHAAELAWDCLERAAAQR